MRARADRIENSMARLKEFCLQAMQMAGVKRIDGTAGRYLLRKGNRGKEPLVVAQPDLVPMDYQTVTVTYRASDKEILRQGLAEISNDLIRKALEDGSAVPGAHLESRGEHIEAK